MRVWPPYAGWLLFDVLRMAICFISIVEAEARLPDEMRMGGALTNTHLASGEGGTISFAKLVPTP